MDAVEDNKLDRNATPPFLLKLFYRTNAFHRPDEFSSPSHLPPYLGVHTWLNCTLSELSHHIVSAAPTVLPDPAIGTRLAFRLVYPDARGGGAPNTPPRFLTKDLGSLVLGSGGPGASSAEDAGDDSREVVRPGADAVTAASDGGSEGGGGEGRVELKTLADAKLVIGDYISCAILPPNPTTGAVEPPNSGKGGRGTGPGVAPLAALPPATVRDTGGPRDGRGMRMGEQPRGGRGGGGRYHVNRRWDRGSGVPFGEWRRGERLPDSSSSWGRGRGSR